MASGLVFVQDDLSKLKLDWKGLRAAMRDIAKEQTKEVKTKAKSGGNYPNRRTGTFYRAIRYKVAKKSARIYTKKTSNMPFFYPAVLVKGSEKRNIKAYGDPVLDTIAQNEDKIINQLAVAIEKAIRAF